MRFSYTKADILKEATKLRLFLAMLLVASFSFIGYSMASNTYAASYTITLNPNGGTYNNTTGTSTKTVSTGSSTNNNVGAATRSGYTFSGWWTATSGGNQVWDSSGNAVAGTYWTTQSYPSPSTWEQQLLSQYSQYEECETTVYFNGQIYAIASYEYESGPDDDLRTRRTLFVWQNGAWTMMTVSGGFQGGYLTVYNNTLYCRSAYWLYSIAISGTTATTTQVSSSSTANPTYSYAQSNTGTSTWPSGSSGSTWQGTSNLTVYARWSKTMTGTDMTSSISPTSYVYDGSTHCPTPTVKDGSTTLTSGTHYSISCSSTSTVGSKTATLSGSNAYNSTTKAYYTGSTSKTYYINNATLTFNATTNGGTGGGTVYTKTGVSVVYTTIRGTTTTSIPTASKSGVTFNGWYTSSSGGTKVLNADGTFAGSVSGYTNGTNWTTTQDRTLYAQYGSIDNTITLNPNSGYYNSTNSTSTLQVSSSSVKNNSVGKAIKNNFSFRGWYTAASGGTQVYDANGFATAMNEDYWTGSSSTSNSVSGLAITTSFNDDGFSATTDSSGVATITNITDSMDVWEWNHQDTPDIFIAGSELLDNFSWELWEYISIDGDCYGLSSYVTGKYITADGKYSVYAKYTKSSDSITIYVSSAINRTWAGNSNMTLYAQFGAAGEAYAEFDSSTGVLRIFRDDPGIYTNGQTSGTKTYYTRLEYITGETLQRWYSKSESITSVVIEDEFMPLTAFCMFENFTNLTSITGLSNLDTSQVTNMQDMFYHCRSLTSLNLSNLDTSNVTNMAGMFDGCSSLTNLNLSNFNTSKLRYTTSMFYNCSSLTNLNLSNFNTSNVTTMASMFAGCSSLTSLDLSSFNTSNVTNMYNMFYNSSSLKILKLGSNFSFAGTDQELTGNWRRDGNTTIYTAANLVANYNGSTMSGIYRRMADGEAYAEFDSSTGVLRIFRDTAGAYTNGQTSGTKTYYSSLESITGNTDPKWYSNRASITSVVIEDIFMPLTAFRMFEGCSNLTSITGISNLDTSQVTIMTYMFQGCSSLTNLNLSNFNTSNVTNMNFMFYLSGLTSLDLSNFDTSQVTTMTYMFFHCTSLTSLDISSFNINSSTFMLGMFNITPSLKVLKLGNNFAFVGTNQNLAGKWKRDGDTTVYTAAQLMADYNGSTMAGTYREIGEAYAEFDSSTGVLRIFRDDAGIYTNGQTSGTKTYYTGIESITGETTRPKWYSNRASITSVVIEDEFMPLTAYWMFSTCTNLISITGMSNLDTSQVTTMDGMFWGCSSLTSLDLSSFNTSQVTNMTSMFKGCTGLTSLNLSNFNTSQVTTMNGMFNGCSGLTSLNISSFNTNNVIYMSSMFEGCSSLTSLDVSNFNTSNVTNMYGIFYGCINLTSLNLSSFNTSQVTNMSSMFYGCSNLTSLNVSNFNTNQVANMAYMFWGCRSLTSLNVSNFNTSQVTTMYAMFTACRSLTSLNVSNFNTSQVTTMSYMFCNCNSLASLNLSNFNTSNVETMDYMFQGCNSLASLNLSNFNTSQVTTMSYMFQDCSSLTSLNLSSFNTSQVTKMNYMFSGCSSITNLDLSSFDTGNVTNMSSMLENTTKLNTLTLGTDWQFSSSTGLNKKWLRDGDTTVYTAAQLTTAYDGSTMSGTYRAVQALTIKETVKGTMAETNKEFDFTINVTNGGVAIDSTHAYTGTKSGNLVFNNGIATFTLKHADNITTYLPYGVSYTITQDSDGYTLSRTNYTGTLTSDKTSTFTDTLNGTTPTGLFADIWPYLLLLLIALVSSTYLYKHSKI